MQRYMKSSMPYYGVPSTPMRQICKACFAGLEFEDAGQWRDSVLHIFRNAKFREEWYASVELCLWKKARAFQTPDALPMYEEMIVTAAWWDIVDTLAGHGVGSLLREHPKPMTKEMLAWSRSDNMWKRRTSILSQLTFKKNTDLKLLYSCIEPSLDSKEFFLRKAIGWALRQYAWTDPKEVKRYVREHESALSPLSKREALKNIG
jgi:3-methyladenine DNA glycosylase AlkD